MPEDVAEAYDVRDCGEALAPLVTEVGVLVERFESDSESEREQLSPAYGSDQSERARRCVAQKLPGK